MPLKSAAQTSDHTPMTTTALSDGRGAEPTRLAREEPHEDLCAEPEEHRAERELLVEPCPEGHHEAREGAGHLAGRRAGEELADDPRRRRAHRDGIGRALDHDLRDLARLQRLASPEDREDPE